MRTAWLWSLAAFHVFQAAGALTTRQNDAPAVVALDTERIEVQDPLSRDRLRRRRQTETVRQDLANEVFYPMTGLDP